MRSRCRDAKANFESFWSVTTRKPISADGARSSQVEPEKPEFGYSRCVVYVYIQYLYRMFTKEKVSN